MYIYFSPELRPTQMNISIYIYIYTREEKKIWIYAFYLVILPCDSLLLIYWSATVYKHNTERWNFDSLEQKTETNWCVSERAIIYAIAPKKVSFAYTPWRLIIDINMCCPSFLFDHSQYARENQFHIHNFFSFWKEKEFLLKQKRNTQIYVFKLVRHLLFALAHRLSVHSLFDSVVHNVVQGIYLIMNRSALYGRESKYEFGVLFFICNKNWFINRFFLLFLNESALSVAGVGWSYWFSCTFVNVEWTWTEASKRTHRHDLCVCRFWALAQ